MARSTERTDLVDIYFGRDGTWLRASPQHDDEHFVEHAADPFQRELVSIPSQSRMDLKSLDPRVKLWPHGLRPGDYIFPGPAIRLTPLSSPIRSHCEGWVASAGLDPARYGTHSLRRTKATLIYKRTSNIRAIQLLLGHSKLESTVWYLGVEVDDALEISEQTKI